MFNLNDYKVNRHSNYNLKYSLGVTTINRIELIDSIIEKELKEIIIINFVKHHKCYLTDSDITIKNKNSVTINFEAPPSLLLPKLISNFKTVSSRLIKKKFEKYLLQYNLEEKFWDSNYYIRTQKA